MAAGLWAKRIRKSDEMSSEGNNARVFIIIVHVVGRVRIFLRDDNNHVAVKMQALWREGSVSVRSFNRARNPESPGGFKGM